MLDYRLTVHDLINDALTVPSGADGDSQLSRDLRRLSEVISLWMKSAEGQNVAGRDVDEDNEQRVTEEVATTLIKTIPRFGGVADRDALIDHLRKWAKSQGVILRES